MTSITSPAGHRRDGGFWGTFGTRQLDRYPSTLPRYCYLGIVVLIAVALYYVYWEEGATLPLMLPSLHMSFQFFLALVVVSNALGAFAAIIGGLADKIGRVNLTLGGMLLIGLLQLVAIPNITNKWGFAIAYSAIGVFEGIAIVVTPTLIRDFSPQVGRASAMGFWTVGPTLGSLAAALVATHTLPHLHPWRDQFVISGAATMVVFVIAFIFMRELAPPLRDQLMVTEKERALVEAKARGIDIREATRHPLRSMLHLDLISSSFGISVYLLVYYAAVTVLVLYWVIVFAETTANANGINQWFWGVNAATVVIIGILSDKVRVRKPFMLFGAAGAIVMTIILLSRATHPETTYYTNVLIGVGLGFALGVAYPTWMAGYTEAVEDKNPALTATGIAVWGWVLRIVVAISFLVMPYVLTTSNTIVNNQSSATALQAINAAKPYAPSPTTLSCAAQPAPATVINNLNATGQPGPTTLATIISTCNTTHSFPQALSAAGGLANPQVVGLTAFDPLATRIQAGKPVPDQVIASTVGTHSQNLANLLYAEKKIVPAQKAAPQEWQRWWWVCVAGQVVFLLLIFTMRGRWSPRAAKRDLDERERLVSEELEKLHREAAAATAGETTGAVGS